jgi:hypothetical protein
VRDADGSSSSRPPKQQDRRCCEPIERVEAAVVAAARAGSTLRAAREQRF